MNATTARLLRRIERLPARKRTALLQLLDDDDGENSTEHEFDREAWKASLLETSVWTEEDIEPILEARRWMNSWKPGSS